MNVDYINIKIIDKFENDRTLQVEQTQIGAPKLVYNGSDDKYQSIMASEFSFNLTVTDKTDGKFFHLYTGNEKRYYVLVEDQDENMIFEGYLLPDFYEEPYTNGVIFVNLVATDGIGLLKGNYLPYEYYEKETSVIKLIAECLKLTKLEKKIAFSPAIESAATDYKWNEIVVDGNSYKDNQDDQVRFSFAEGYILPKRKNTYEILELLLKSLGCTLYGQGDKWYLEGINRKHESLQLNELYSFEGVYIESLNLDKTIMGLVFFSNPTISIKSPWKRVDYIWDIDEDGDLVPDWAIEDKIQGIFDSNPPKDVNSFWKTNGALTLNVLSKNLQTKYQKQAVFGIVDTGVSLPPLNLYVLRTYGEPGVIRPINYYGEDNTNYPNNYISIKNKKYLKISDEFIDRNFEIDINYNGGDKYSVGASSIPNIDDKEFSNMFKFTMLSSAVTVFSTRYNAQQSNLKFECDRQDESSTASNELVAGDFFTLTSSMVKSKLEIESLLLPSNGFFDVQLHAPVSPDHTTPRFYGYVVESMSIKYTAQKTLLYSPERNIDFTTVYELDTFHGDSVQDLSIKQFRFRRPIYSSLISGRNINQLSQQVIDGIYYIGLSYQDFIAISSNLSLFVVEYDGQEIFMNDLGVYSYEVYVSSSGGYYWLRIYPVVINHPSGIGSSINDFSVLKIKETPSFLIGYETEDNEWREQWKRHGQTENIRFVKAISKMYHDVQSGPLVCIEGTLATTFFPRDLGSFIWQNPKEFIASRIEIDFSNGKSNVFMIESLNQIVTDYVN